MRKTGRSVIHGYCDRSRSLHRDLAAERTPLNGLALALYGADAAKRWELASDDYPYLSGSPTWLRKKLSNWTKWRSLHGEVPDARRVFLAGAAQMETEGKLWMKYRAGASDADRHLVETYGAIKSPHTVTLMVDMYARSKAKALVGEWFGAHADYAARHLEGLAKGRGKLAKTAKVIHSGVPAGFS